jgi:N-acetylmuramoyl-L-alanine amidase
MCNKRDGIVFVGLMLAWAWACPALAGVTVKAVRLWPSPDYSRITFELSEKPDYKVFTLKNPDRLVLDLTGVENGTVLQAASAQVSAQDPLIANLRAGLNAPGVTRVVVQLKGEANPKAFTLAPLGEYGNRLVIDLYPSADKQAANTEGQVEKAIAQASQPSISDAKPETHVADVPPAKAPETTPAATVLKPSLALVSEKPARSEKETVVDRPKKANSNFVRLITVAIDAGHGGEDPGASGANGSHEKNITLEIARRLKAHIDKMDNMRAVLTRDGDYFVPLAQRVVKARKAQADLFVSIHADAFPSEAARGSSVFALSEKGATSAAARWLAKRENEADMVGGVNIDVKDKYLKQTLIDLTQTATISDSLKLANNVLGELGDINNLHRGHVEQAGFAVLKAPDIPSILVETAFISNPDEEKRLLSDDYQEKLASAITEGIKRYFDKNPPLAGGKVARNM